MFQEQWEENPKECGREDAALFDTTADDECPREAAVELHCALHVGVEGICHVLQSWWAADLWDNLKQAVSADKIKRFGEVNESDAQGFCCYLHFWS